MSDRLVVDGILSPQELFDIHQVFNMFDPTRSKRIWSKHLHGALWLLGYSETDHYVCRILKDRSFVTISQFLSLVAQLKLLKNFEILCEGQTLERITKEQLAVTLRSEGECSFTTNDVVKMLERMELYDAASIDLQQFVHRLINC